MLVLVDQEPPFTVQKKSGPREAIVTGLITLFLALLIDEDNSIDYLLYTYIWIFVTHMTINTLYSKSLSGLITSVNRFQVINTDCTFYCKLIQCLVCCLNFSNSPTICTSGWHWIDTSYMKSCNC